MSGPLGPARRWAMSALLWLHDSRLTPLALSPLPAWLWSTDATRVLWANPTGAALFDAPTPAALTVRVFGRDETAAREVARLSGSLRPSDPPRFEHLNGFASEIGRSLTCACSRVTLSNGTSAVLVAAAERSGPSLSLDQRALRLLAAGVEPIAVFRDDGALIRATPAAERWIGRRRSLAALGAGALVTMASAVGHASGHCLAGLISIDRDRSQAVWFVAFGNSQPPQVPAIAQIAAPMPMPANEQTSGQRPAESLRNIEPETPAAPIVNQAELFEDLPLVSSASVTPANEHLLPLRFVWQLDADGCFIIDSAAFTAIMGPRTAALLGQPWPFIASMTNLDSEGNIARAITTRDTWSGMPVRWRIDGFEDRLDVELSGFPVFDQDRTFIGYRGFGLCRDVARLEAIARVRGLAGSPAAANAPAAEDLSPTSAPGLTPIEHVAFDELSRQLSSRINEADAQALRAANANAPAEPQDPPSAPSGGASDAASSSPDGARPFLDRLPVGVLVYSLSHLLYANPAFLSWVGSASVEALADAGGLDSLMIKSGDFAIDAVGGKSFSIASLTDEQSIAEARLIHVPWDGESVFALLAIPPSGEPGALAALGEARAQRDELKAILDTATDGVIVLDRDARILSANSSAQALFGYDAHELVGRGFDDLLAPESVDTAFENLGQLQEQAVAALLNDGSEVIGRERLGGLIPLFMTMGRIGDDGRKYCAVFRDITFWKQTEENLVAARRDAEHASSAKSDFLAKISHEIRTPLNAIIGFSEVMTEERFGPIGNERYRQYLKDIHTSGEHLISLINDLLDLSKIEAGKLELTFGNVAINDLIQQCVAIMQPQANRERVIIRTSLAPRLPQVVADARSVRQIVLNLLSNSIKFTVTGGQVIVSTAISDTGEVALRVRDTGIGMSDADIATALEPFRQVATATRARPGGTGLGLPLTKALAEANHASFQIKSTPNEGTLVEIMFAGARLLAAQ